MHLEVFSQYWLPHLREEHDLCAHGLVSAVIGGETLSSAADGDWCTSAAGLFLLRTLDPPLRGAEHRKATQLIPHCGHTMFADRQSGDVIIETCQAGLTWDVIDEGTWVRLRVRPGIEETIPRRTWVAHVVRFADQVAAFYAASLPKQPEPYETDGFRAFQFEWERRLSAAHRYLQAHA